MGYMNHYASWMLMHMLHAEKCALVHNNVQRLPTNILHLNATGIVMVMINDDEVMLMHIILRVM